MEAELEFEPRLETALAKLAFDEEAFEEESRFEVGAADPATWPNKEDKENANWADEQGAMPRSPGAYFRLYSESMKEPNFDCGGDALADEPLVDLFLEGQPVEHVEEDMAPDPDFSDVARVLAAFFVRRRSESDTSVILREIDEAEGKKGRKRIHCGGLPREAPTACAIDLTNENEEDVSLHVAVFSSSLFLSLLTEEDVVIPKGQTHRLVLQAQPSAIGNVSGNVVVGSALCTFEALGVPGNCELDMGPFDKHGRLIFAVPSREDNNGCRTADKVLRIVNSSTADVRAKLELESGLSSNFGVLPNGSSVSSNDLAHDSQISIPRRSSQKFYLQYRTHGALSEANGKATVFVGQNDANPEGESTWIALKTFQLVADCAAGSRTRTASPTPTVDLSDLLGCEVRSPEGNSRLFVNRWLSEGVLRLKNEKRTATATLKNKGCDNIVAQISLEGKNAHCFIVSPDTMCIPGDGREHFRLTRLDAAPVNSELSVRISVEDKGEVTKRYRFSLDVSRDLKDDEKPVVNFDRPVVTVGDVGIGETKTSTLRVQLLDAPLPATLHLKPIKDFQFSSHSIEFTKVGEVADLEVSLTGTQPGFFRSFLQLEGDIIRHGSPGIPIWGYCGKANFECERQRVSDRQMKLTFKNIGQRAGYIQCPRNVTHVDQRALTGGGVIVPERMEIALLMELGSDDTVVEWGDEIIRRRRRRCRRAVQSPRTDEFDFVYDGEQANQESREFNSFPLRESHFDDAVFQTQRTSVRIVEVE